MRLTGQTLLRIHTYPTGQGLQKAVHPLRSLVMWGAVAAMVGGLIGLAVEILSHTVVGQPIQWSIVWQNVLAAEAIAMTALVGSRYAFPQFESQPWAVRYGLIVLTLLGGALVAGIISLATRPGIIFTRPLAFVALVGANTLLAILLSVGLITWDSLKRSLERAYEELRVKEAFEREMALARDVQQELLPEKAPHFPGMRIAFTCQSAAAVGGDTIDFVELPGGKLGLAVGDVVGKGVAAALLMANLQALVRALAPHQPSPARLNAQLSHAIGNANRPGRFVTFAYVILDPATWRLRYSLAGHHPPLIVGPGGVRELEKGGLPLGIMAGTGYEEGENLLRPGESLLLFTDGVVEAPPADGSDDQFGKERLIEIAQKESRKGPAVLLDAVLTALDAYCGDQPAADDTTLLIVERLGDDPPETQP